MNSALAVIQCENLCKQYHDAGESIDVLQHVNLQVKPGEMVAIIGASGAGKSTLLQLLGGLDKPDSGEILIAGEEINRLSEKKRAKLRNHRLGFIYQFHHLLPEFDALENVAMPLLIRGWGGAKAKGKAAAFLGRVGLSKRLHHRISQLSGGERQRVAIARALVTEPDCVLADEPTGNLDQATAEQVYQLMLSLNSEFNTSYVVVTHNRSLASHLNRTLILEQAQLMPINLSPELSAKPTGKPLIESETESSNDTNSSIASPAKPPSINLSSDSGDTLSNEPIDE